MAKLEELTDSDEEEEPKKPEEPPMDFNEMMKKAAEMKTAQLKDKRRFWDEAPDWLKNTLTHERQGEVRDIREQKSVEERLAAAVKFKEAGNALYTKGKYNRATDQYICAISLFMLFKRNDKKEEIWFEKEYEQYESATEREAAQQVLVLCCINLAQCQLKINKASEAITACDYALELEPNNVKALYRRGLARVAEDTSTSLEAAVRDLKRAHALAPDDPGITAAYRKHGHAGKVQREKDTKLYGGLAKGNVYSKKEQEEVTKAAPRADPDDILKTLPEAEIKRRALALGLDLDDPETRRQLEAQAQKARKKELQDKAKELGGLSDPEVQRLFELFEKEKELEAMQQELGEIPHWRRFLVRALDPSAKFNVQRCFYVLIALNTAYKLYQMWIAWPTRGGAGQEEEEEDPFPSVWNSNFHGGEF